MDRGRPVTNINTLLSAAILAVALIVLPGCKKHRPIVLKGAVIREDPDTRKQQPLSDVEITAANSLALAPAKSDASGFFKLTLHPGIKLGQPVVLKFRHADYEPLEATDFAGDFLFVSRMVPIVHTEAAPKGPEAPISNVRVRYSIKSTTTVDVGSGVKTFQVVNTPNVPCNGQPPCSPDGKWKASIGFITLEAGEGNEFRNARVSCIAGPCPFTKIEHDGFSRGGRTISVSVRDWSDTTTFLVEAEIFRSVVSDQGRTSYPVIFGKALSFSLPPTAEGTSIEAEVNGEPIVFPLGPSLCLPWTDCTLTIDKEQARTYRCGLKPGFQFK